MNLTPMERDALRELYEISPNLLDLVDSKHNTQTLASLQQKRLAVRWAPGLWRISLLGLLYHRDPPPEPEPAERGRPATVRERLIDFVREHPGCSSREVRDALGYKRAPTELGELAKRGMVERRSNPHAGVEYLYFPKEASE